MFKVRSQQKAFLSQEATRDFEDRMVTHLGKFFPAYCDVLGEAAVRRTIRYGILQAGKYGIVAERGVCIFIDAMFAFGRNFDSDPEVAWARGILTDRKIKDPRARADKLFDAAFEHLGEARGLRREEVEA
ncbi:hypothetical protein ACMHYB_00785 [Sorangium sp. So ce1128]